MPQRRASGTGAGVSTGDVTGVGIAIGENASVRIYGDVYYAPLMLSAPLREAFAPLLEDRTRLFGGRGAVVDRIGEFVRGPGGFLVITAPAGFGKTSLMASLVAGAPDAFAYHFFTPLYDADGLSEDFFLRNVVEQLAQWHGRKGNLPEQRVQLRALYQELLDEPLDTTQVLLLDGLDEVLGWSMRPYLARRLPERMHVIATVRDVGQEWQLEYGFPAEQTTGFALEGLGRAEVVDVLESAGGAARALAGDPEALDHVVRVAAFPDDPALGADPFYMRLLAQDLADGTIDAATIGDRTPGLEHYLDEWWQEIKRAAGDDATRDLFGTLAAAAGPVPRADLEHLNPSLVDAWATDRFDDVLRGVRRLVLEDEHGYSLVHPRLGEYVGGKINVEPYGRRLLELCRGWRDHPSEYAYSYGAYTLFAAGALDELVGLVCPEWMTARLRQTGSHAAFAEDVALAHRVALAMQPPDLVEAMRLSLVYATLGSFAGDTPPAALGVLVRLGRAPQALRLAALIQHAATRATAYRMIAEAWLDAGNVTAARDALARALAAADALHLRRPDALAELAPAFAAAGCFETLMPRLDPWALPDAALSLAEATDPASAAEALQQIADIAALREDPEQRAFLLALVCDGWARLGDAERARSLVPQLADTVTAVGEHNWGANVVPTAAAAAAHAGDRANAIAWAGRARDALLAGGRGVHPEQLPLRIARAYAAAGEVEMAMDVAHGELQKGSGLALRVAVEEIADAGELDALRPRLLAAAAMANGMSAGAVDVAFALAKAGEIDAARELAASIQDEYWRRAASQELASALAEQRCFDEALAIADGGSQAMHAIACALAGAGDFDRAIDVAGHIDDSSLAAKAFAAIAEGLIRAAQPQRAAELVEQALDPLPLLTERDQLAEALFGAARRLAEGDEMRSGTLHAAALEITIPAGLPPSAASEEMLRAGVRSGPFHGERGPVSGEAVRAEDPGAGEDPVDSEDVVAEEPAEDDWTARDRRRWELSERVDQLADEVQELVQRGEWEAARSTADEAVAAARAIDIEDSIKDGALVQAARIVAGSGDAAAGVELLGEVAEWPRAAALDGLARSYAEVGAQDYAVYVWSRGFSDLERTTRHLVFRGLQTATWLIDDDEVLWRLCQAVLEVERWWEPPSAEV